MSTQSKTMPKLDLNVYIRVVAAVFAVSKHRSISLFTLLSAVCAISEPSSVHLDSNWGVHFHVETEILKHKLF